MPLLPVPSPRGRRGDARGCRCAAALWRAPALSQEHGDAAERICVPFAQLDRELCLHTLLLHSPSLAGSRSLNISV